jgi:hypothetical protein
MARRSAPNRSLTRERARTTANIFHNPFAISDLHKSQKRYHGKKTLVRPVQIG